MLQNNSFDNELEDDYYDDEDTMQDKYLIFGVEERQYGIPIEYVLQIVGLMSIKEIPDMPGFVRGVINLRGKIIPVIDIRMRFSLPFKEYHDRTGIIIVSIDGKSLGLIVDSVRDVLKIPAESIEPSPSVGNTPGSRFVMGIGKFEDELKILLSLDKLINKDEMDVIEENKEAIEV